MEFQKVLALRGPNVWAHFPVLEAWVVCGGLSNSASSEIPDFNERLTGWLPLVEHRCSVGEHGGFLERLRRGTYLAHILEHVALELQSLAGTPVGFGRTAKRPRSPFIESPSSIKRKNSEEHAWTLPAICASQPCTIGPGRKGGSRSIAATNATLVAQRRCGSCSASGTSARHSGSSSRRRRPRATRVGHSATPGRWLEDRSHRRNCSRHPGRR